MFKTLSYKTFPYILATLALAGCNGYAGHEQRVSDQMIKSAEAIIAPWASDIAPGVAVAVSLGDEVVFARGAGLANLEYNQEIAPDSVFLVASVSKQFTAFATLLLVSEGKVDLDADIRTYIPELREPPRIITVRHLLDHMSGLRERNLLAAMAGWMEDDIQTEAQLTELVVRQRGVNFLAGDKVEYSNTGYALLAEIVARVCGQSFQSFMHERMFEPLKMTQTRFPDSRNDLIPNRVSSYYPEGEGFKNIVSAQEAIGATGLYTTALDLLKWAENFETQIVGDAMVFEMMAQRSIAANGKPSTFGRGQELRPYNGLQTWSHGGRDAGYRSFLLRVPEEDFELSILSNRADFDTAKMAFALLDTFLGSSANYKVAPLSQFEPATPAELSAYAGDYEFYPGAIFSLRVEANGLTFAPLGVGRDGLDPLPQIGQRRFMLNPQADISIVFASPLNGVSAGFEYQIGLHGTLDAKRIELGPFDQESVNRNNYVGIYYSEELETIYRLTLVDGKLTAKHIRLPAFELTPIQDDVFTGLGGPLQKVEFTRSTDGRLTGFYASAPVAERVEFKLIDQN